MFKITIKGNDYTVELEEEVDNLKANWGVWSCKVFDSKDGEFEATIQSDGEHIIAPETLEFS